MNNSKIPSTSNTPIVSSSTGQNMSLPVGLRNNNPLNLVVSNNNWLGKVASNNRFEKFSSLEYGMRANVINLRTYYNKYNLKSISQIINKWAPPVENNVLNYITRVVADTGFGSGMTLPYTKDTFASLAAAMSAVELGDKYKVSKTSWLAVIEKFKLIG